MHSANNPPDSDAAAPGEAAQADEAHASGFAATESGELTDAPVDWWPESADGQCSQSAALFAASQPAPLNVV